jgi:hypothetical protein
MANPVDMSVDNDIMAIADYDNGVHFINLKTVTRRHFKTTYRICGVQFLHEDSSYEGVHVVMLAYIDEKWTINVHSWPEFKEEYVLECPLQPNVPPWARRKITIIDTTLYMLGTSEVCSAIWTLNMTTNIWFD